MSDFLQDTLGSANPYSGVGQDVTVLEALAGASAKIDESFPDQPETKAAVLNTIGTTYANLDRYDEAESMLQSALTIRRDIFGAAHPDVADTLIEFGTLRYLQGDYETAESMLSGCSFIRMAQTKCLANRWLRLLRYRSNPESG